MIIAVAVNTEGKREIVGLHIGPSDEQRSAYRVAAPHDPATPKPQPEGNTPANVPLAFQQPASHAASSVNKSQRS